MKVTKTYSIDDKIFDIFDDMSKTSGFNKSSIIEENIKKYIIDNYETDPTQKWYVIQDNDNLDSDTIDFEVVKKLNELNEELRNEMNKSSKTISKSKIVKIMADINKLSQYNKLDTSNDLVFIKKIDFKNNDLIFTLDSGDELPIKDFYEKYQKCVNDTDFFSTCNIYDCEKINESVKNLFSDSDVNHHNVVKIKLIDLDDENIKTKIEFSEKTEKSLKINYYYSLDKISTTYKTFNFVILKKLNSNEYIVKMDDYISNFLTKEENYYKFNQEVDYITIQDSTPYINEHESYAKFKDVEFYIDDNIISEYNRYDFGALNKKLFKDKEKNEELRTDKYTTREYLVKLKDVYLNDDKLSKNEIKNIFSNKNEKFIVMYHNTLEDDSSPVGMIRFISNSFLDGYPIFRIICAPRFFKFSGDFTIFRITDKDMTNYIENSSPDDLDLLLRNKNFENTENIEIYHTNELTKTTMNEL